MYIIHELSFSYFIFAHASNIIQCVWSETLNLDVIATNQNCFGNFCVNDEAALISKIWTDVFSSSIVNICYNISNDFEFLYIDVSVHDGI